ncbi:DUF3237 domain-containing protein [Bradyrhizobium sp.]|uniref:DUF3237 domain-containing protein n=1 Tax=Bradyrhizobium sp. TaxID=376 RepID=UPI0025BB2CD6|nr:DUF3237 domain-containing protein [Bradyrhizobium sp.]
MSSSALLASEYLMRLAAEFDEPQTIENGPHGTRRILYMTGGSFDGAKLSGAVMPRGADWVTARPDGVFQLDIRLTLRADDGALIYVSSSGLFDIEPGKLGRLRRGEPMAASEYYFRTTLMFETGALRYGWPNRILAVGIGTRTPTGMSTEVFALT